MRHLFLIGFFSFSIPVFSQTNTIDSLLKVLQTEKEDTNKVNTLNQVCRFYILKVETGMGFLYANKELSLSEKLNFSTGKANSFNYLGLANFQQQNYPEALRYLYTSLSISEKLNAKDKMADARQFIGGVYVVQRNYPEALKNLGISLKLREEIGDSGGIAQSLNSLGEIYSGNGNYSLALEKHLAALKISKALGKRAPNWSLAYCYSSIGGVYERQGDLINTTDNKINAIKKFREALTYYFLSLTEWEMIGRKDGIAPIYLFIGHLNIKLGNLAEAKSCFQKGLQLSIEADDKEDLQYSYSAILTLDTIRGDYKQAFRHYQLYIAYRDSITNEETKKKSMEARLQYEFDKKESAVKSEQDKKDVLTDAEITRQKMVRNFSVTGTFAILSLGGFVFYNFRKRKKLEGQQALSSERLRISRELHDDIGSTLGSIAVYSDVAKNRSVKNENPVEVLSKIGTASRDLIEKMSDIVWSLNPDNETFEQLQIRMQGFAAMILTPRGIAIEFKTGDELKTLQLSNEQRKNIFLIYKEALHNIVKYADCKNVFISLTKPGSNLLLTVKDNGKGFDQENIAAYNGHGLKNMKARSDEINGVLSLISQINEGTTIELSLTL
jgi:two-component system sensor histidine kinase UhpB